MDIAQSIFSKIFLNLLKDLSEYYSEYSEFQWYYNFLNTFGTSIMWKNIFIQYKEYTLPFKKQIEQQDEAFFIQKEFLEQIEVPDGNVVQEMERIRELYFMKKTTPEIKAKLWDYIGKLTKLAHSK